ncbi:hypothetical protein JCM8208_002836 [Rhodotorula glutinis]
MSSEWDQTCLVCGVKTSNRCSRCAKAGITISFCSPDHQALVWKAHRHFCGPGKANPFTWPLLPQDQADEIVEHMFEPAEMLASSSMGTRPTVADSLLLWAAVPRDELPVIVQSLAKPSLRGSRPHERQGALAVVRALETMRRAPRKGGPGMFRMPYIDPVQSTAYHDFYNIDKRGSGVEPWRTKYRHMLAVELFLLDMWDRSAGKDVPVEWFDRLFARDEDFARVLIAPDYPIHAARLITGESASFVFAERLKQYAL